MRVIKQAQCWKQAVSDSNNKSYFGITSAKLYNKHIILLCAPHYHLVVKECVDEILLCDSPDPSSPLICSVEYPPSVAERNVHLALKMPLKTTTPQIFSRY